MIRQAPAVALNGTDLSTRWLDRLVEVRVERELCLASRTTLRFADEGFVLAGDGAVTMGSTVAVSSGGAAMFAGEVTAVSVDQRSGEQPELVVVAHDRAYRLGRGSTVTTYLTMTVSDVVAKVGGQHGLTVAADATSGSMPYLLQVDSDLGLLSTLADRVGYDWWVEDRTLHFKKPAAGATVGLTVGDDLRSFSVRATASRPDKVQVGAWDVAQKKSAPSTASAPRSTVVAASPLGDKAKQATQLGAATLVVLGSAAASAAETKELSEAVLDAAAAASVTARGETLGNPAIVPGCTVRVTGGGPLAGTYPVTRVEHVFRQRDGFLTRFAAGTRRPTSLVDTVDGGRPSPMLHDGLLVGVVTNNNDPDKSGRVKVKFPGVAEGEESTWARLTAVGGGNKRGMVFVPEVNDEVLVGFEGGDLRRPVVLGGLWGTKDTLPLTKVDDQGVQQRGMTSRLGHVFEMGDGQAPADQHLVLALAGGKTKLRLGEDKGSIEIPDGVPFSIKVGGQSGIEFDGKGAVKITGTEISIAAATNLTLEAKANAKLKGTAQTAVEGAAVAVKAQATLEVSASGPTTVKGLPVKIN